MPFGSPYGKYILTVCAACVISINGFEPFEEEGNYN